MRIINKETLRTKINKLLTNHDFKNSLQSRQIMIGQISEPKQTETTQRWKLGLKVNNFSTLIPTKLAPNPRAIKLFFSNIKSYEIYRRT